MCTPSNIPAGTVLKQNAYLWNETEKSLSFIVVEQMPQELVSQLLFTGAVGWQCVEQFTLTILLTKVVYLFPLPLKSKR